MDRATWETLGSQEAPSWYLHPLVGQQKRDVHVDLIRRWTQGRDDRFILKTDLFEEAFGDDFVLPGLFSRATLVCGMDSAASTVRAAALRHRSIARGAAVMDVRQPAWAPESFDLIVSTSTLDHFKRREDFAASIEALSALLRPGGLLILTLDNPLNPLYHLLRWYSRSAVAPFPLGYTPMPATLRRDLERCGLRIRDRDWLLHNPRGFSTLLFLVFSRLFGRRGDAAIRLCLKGFALMGRLPSRRFTACFQAVAVVKPPDA